MNFLLKFAAEHAGYFLLKLTVQQYITFILVTIHIHDYEFSLEIHKSTRGEFSPEINSSTMQRSY